MEPRNYTRAERYMIPRVAYMSGIAHGIIIGGAVVIALLTVTHYLGGI